MDACLPSEDPRAVLEELGIEPQRVHRFETAGGRVLERDVAFALLYAAGRSTASVVVFADHGDLVLLGAHGLEGLNVRVDVLRREPVPAGPLPAALAWTDYSSRARVGHYAVIAS
jgi:hypothetical protein